MAALPIITSVTRLPFLEAVIRSPTFNLVAMANLMLNHPTYCYYNPVVGMQNKSDESDEATRHPIDRVPSRVGAAAGPEIVDVDTLAQKVVDDNTAFCRWRPRRWEGTQWCSFLLRRMCVLQEANDCRRPRQSSVRKTRIREREHLLRCQSMLRRVGHGSFYMVDLIRPVYGRSVRRRCKRLFSYARKHADVQVEHFGRDTCVSHH